MTTTLNTRFRTLLLLGVTLLALAMSGTAAFAGEDDDGDDEDDAPVPTQVAPAPVPVKPAPAQPAPAQPAPAKPAPAQPAPAAQQQSKPTSVAHGQQVSTSTRSATAFQAGQVIPRGGVRDRRRRHRDLVHRRRAFAPARRSGRAAGVPAPRTRRPRLAHARR